MNRIALGVPAAILVCSVSIWASLPDKSQLRRLHGTVVGTHATYCEPKKEDGCTGTLTLERPRGWRRELLTIRVPLGTPISNGCQALWLGQLEGRRVTVTEAEEATGLVARAVTAPDASC
jgi:hypothetical protein